MKEASVLPVQACVVFSSNLVWRLFWPPLRCTTPFGVLQYTFSVCSLSNETEQPGSHKYHLEITRFTADRTSFCCMIRLAVLPNIYPAGCTLLLEEILNPGGAIDICMPLSQLATLTGSPQVIMVQQPSPPSLSWCYPNTTPSALTAPPPHKHAHTAVPTDEMPRGTRTLTRSPPPPLQTKTTWRKNSTHRSASLHLDQSKCSNPSPPSSGPPNKALDRTLLLTKN